MTSFSAVTLAVDNHLCRFVLSSYRCRVLLRLHACRCHHLSSNYQRYVDNCSCSYIYHCSCSYIYHWIYQQPFFWHYQRLDFHGITNDCSHLFYIYICNCNHISIINFLIDHHFNVIYFYINHFCTSNQKPDYHCHHISRRVCTQQQSLLFHTLHRPFCCWWVPIDALHSNLDCDRASTCEEKEA